MNEDLSQEQAAEQRALDHMIDQTSLGSLIGKKLRVVDQWANLLYEGPAVIGGYSVGRNTVEIDLKCVPPGDQCFYCGLASVYEGTCTECGAREV